MSKQRKGKTAARASKRRRSATTRARKPRAAAAKKAKDSVIPPRKRRGKGKENAAAGLARELAEARAQQAATGEVLRLISNSNFDLRALFEKLIEQATRLCRADKANIARLEGDSFQYVASFGFRSDYIDYMKALPMSVDRGTVIGRAVLERGTVHVHDALADPEWRLLGAQKLGTFRTALGVPLMREGIPIGAMFLSRSRIAPFAQHEIELIETF